jgi:Family of unknown function (DUF6508)
VNLADGEISSASSRGQIVRWNHCDHYLSQRDKPLEVLAKYLPIFTAPGFQFSEVVPAKRKGDVIQLGWTSYGPEAQSFMQDCYDYGWVQSTQWMEWMRSDEAQALRARPGS